MRRPEAAGAPPLGAFSWHELATSDNEAAFAFYSGLFGWDAIQRMDMGPTGVYLIFGENGVQRGGIYIKPAENPGPPNWLPYVHVPNADEGYAVALVEGREGHCAAHGRAGRRPHRQRDRSGGRRVCRALHVSRAEGDASREAQGRCEGESETQGEGEGEAKPKAKPKKAAPARKKAPAKKKVAKQVAKAKKGLKKFVKAAVKKYQAAKKKSAPRKKSKAVRRKK